MTKSTETEESIAFRKALKEFDINAVDEHSDGYKVVDLYIHDAKLYIEIDGMNHYTDPDQIERDLNRDHYSDEAGYRTIRIPNEHIQTHCMEVAKAVAEVAKRRM